MKLSVYNFKGIKEIENLELDDITVLSGVNSCGKSTLIQIFLLLKQSVEYGNLDQPLILNMPYVSLGNYRHLTYGKKDFNKFRLIFKISKEEFQSKSYSYRKGFNLIFSKEDIENFQGCKLEVSFHYVNASAKILVDTFKLSFDLGGKSLDFSAERIRTKYKVKTNSDVFYSLGYYNRLRKMGRTVSPRFSNRQPEIEDIEIDRLIPEEELNISFQSFFPDRFDNKNESYISTPSFLFKIVQEIISDSVKGYKYIGPLREEPKSHYTNENDTISDVGNKGQFSAHILSRNSSDVCDYYAFNQEDGSFILKTATLKEAVEYWLCDVFKMAKSIHIDNKNYNSFYIINIINESSISVPITHVGFGISQILPIIVAGLRLSEGGVLILEQPEIHLHPKVQSLLFDFIYSLVLMGKKVVVETHSDHFITRLRRRVAEDDENILVNKIGVYFIEKSVEDKNIDYKKLHLNDLGNMDCWPVGFFDQRDHDLKAIVKAQIKKNINK